MKKSFMIIVYICLMLSSTAALADPFDLDTAAFMREQTKETFYNECQARIKDATTAMCTCLTNKIVASLNDTAVNRCGDDSACLTSAIMSAGKTAFTEANIKACSH